MCVIFLSKKLKHPFVERASLNNNIRLFVVVVVFFFSVFEFNCGLKISGDSTYCDNNLLES